MENFIYITVWSGDSGSRSGFYRRGKSGLHRAGSPFEKKDAADNIPLKG